MNRQRITSFVKFFFAGAVLYYLITSGKLDLRGVGQTLSSIRWLIPALLLVGVNIFCNTMRWHLLLKGQNIHLPFLGTLKISFIGLFFNFFLPSSIGGDVVKGYYIASAVKGSRTEAIMTIFLDRLSGIAGLAILAPIGALFSYRLGILTPALMPVLYAVCLLSLGIGSFFFLALSPRLYHSGIFQKLMSFLPFKEHWHRAYSAVFAYRHRLDKLFGAFLLTLVSQSAFTLNFYFAAVQVGGVDLPLSLFFFLVPLGMLVTAVPLFPGGIGIGQAAFLQLFYWAGATGTTFGADAFTLLQLVNFCWNMIGVVFYIQKKEKLVATLGLGHS